MAAIAVVTLTAVIFVKRTLIKKKKVKSGGGCGSCGSVGTSKTGKRLTKALHDRKYLS